MPGDSWVCPSPASNTSIASPWRANHAWQPLPPVTVVEPKRTCGGQHGEGPRRQGVRSSHARFGQWRHQQLMPGQWIEMIHEDGVRNRPCQSPWCLWLSELVQRSRCAPASCRRWRDCNQTGDVRWPLMRWRPRGMSGMSSPDPECCFCLAPIQEVDTSRYYA